MNTATFDVGLQSRVISTEVEVLKMLQNTHVGMELWLRLAAVHGTTSRLIRNASTARGPIDEGVLVQLEGAQDSARGIYASFSNSRSLWQRMYAYQCRRLFEKMEVLRWLLMDINADAEGSTEQGKVLRSAGDVGAFLKSL